jgi:hypothetical protein
MGNRLRFRNDKNENRLRFRDESHGVATRISSTRALTRGSRLNERRALQELQTKNCKL